MKINKNCYKEKKGVSMVILVITIVVMIILASTVIFISANANNNAKLVALANDITTIEELANEYYVNNGNLPIITADSKTASGMTSSISDSTWSADLSKEIQTNGDTADTFYKVDLTLLPIDSTIRGTQADGNVNDVFYIAGKSRNVYYLFGEKIGGVYYFSLTKELSGKTKIQSTKTDDNSNVQINGTSPVIKLTKDKKTYTNELKISISTTINADERLDYSFYGHLLGDIAKEVLDRGTAIILLNNAYAENTVDFNYFYTNGPKQAKLQKVNKNTSAVIAESILDISNLDLVSPNKLNIEANQTTPTLSIESQSTSNYLKFTGQQDAGGSGLKGIKYEYLTKVIDQNGATGNYYDNPITVDKDYLLRAGKDSSASIIKIPKNVKTLAVSWTDNAGNISNPVTYTVDSSYTNYNV